MDTAVVRSPSSITVNTTLIHAGNSSGGSFPSMASVNADYTHFNQAVALYNRRTNQCMSTPDVMGYFSSGSITASGLTTLRTKIDVLRAKFGLGAQTYTNATRSAGDQIKKKDLDELFTALNWTSVITIFGDIDGMVARINQHPYGTGGTWANQSSTTYVGVVAVNGDYQRDRYGNFFTIPSLTGLVSPLSAVATFVIDPYSFGNTLETFVPRLYSSNTNDSAFGAGWQNNLNNFESDSVYGTAAGTGATADYNFTLNSSNVLARAGSIYSVILGNSLELTDSDVAYSGSTTKRAQFDQPQNSTLVLNWGF